MHAEMNRIESASKTLSSGSTIDYLSIALLV